jgi:hypothetical protein
VPRRPSASPFVRRLHPSTRPGCQNLRRWWRRRYRLKTSTRLCHHLQLILLGEADPQSEKCVGVVVPRRHRAAVVAVVVAVVVAAVVRTMGTSRPPTIWATVPA